MTSLSSRKTALALLAVLGLTSASGLTIRPAQADDSSAAKKVALAAGAVALYGVLSGKGKVATAGGVVAAGAYAKYRADKHDEQNNDNPYDRRGRRLNDSRFDNENAVGNGYYGDGTYDNGTYGSYNNDGYGSYGDGRYNNGIYGNGNGSYATYSTPGYGNGRYAEGRYSDDRRNNDHSTERCPEGQSRNNRADNRRESRSYSRR